MVFDILAWGVTFIVGYVMGKGSAKLDLMTSLIFPETRSRYQKWKERKDKSEKVVD